MTNEADVRVDEEQKSDFDEEWLKGKQEADEELREIGFYF